MMAASSVAVHSFPLQVECQSVLLTLVIEVGMGILTTAGC